MKEILVIIFAFLIYQTTLFAQDNLLEDKNPNCDGTSYYTYGSSTKYSTITHTDDGSGSFKFSGDGSDFLQNNVVTSTFTLKAGRKYVMRAYMKMRRNDYGQNILLKCQKTDGSLPTEMHWNVNKIDEWEEVILPYYAHEDGEYQFIIFAWPKYMHTTDGQFGESDGSNLTDCPLVYLDDFSVVEMNTEEILSNEPAAPKVPFTSEYIKVDEEGNFQVKEDGNWHYIFPKIAYQSWYGDFAKESAHMAEYGFDGWANISSLDRLHTAYDNGLKYNGIQINNLEATKALITDVVNDMNNDKIPNTAVITYVIDNEMESLCRYESMLSYGSWLDQNDTDPTTNRRARPVLVFNGQAEGIARSYKNDNTDLMDITGSYVSKSGEESDFRYNPTSNISLLRNSDKQTAPAVFLDVQSYYHYSYIPSIFKGILNGAKGLKFWRGGTDYKGSAMDFRNNVWADALKGPDGVFARIDSMLLPIIVQPMGTSWEAEIPTEARATIAIGTRDNEELNKHYIIIANFSDNDTTINITLNGLNANSAKDFFTKEETGTINGNILTVKVGHYNDGYLVLELEGDVTTAVSKSKLTGYKVYPNPANDYVVVESKNELIKKIDLIDITGKSVRTITGIMQNSITINISALLNGLYFIKTQTSNNDVLVNKILIQ
jgi:hypothetical protein